MNMLMKRLFVGPEILSGLRLSFGKKFLRIFLSIRFTRGFNIYAKTRPIHNGDRALIMLEKKPEMTRATFS